MAVAGDVYGGVLLCCAFSHEMSLMRTCTKLSQFQFSFVLFGKPESAFLFLLCSPYLSLLQLALFWYADKRIAGAFIVARH